MERTMYNLRAELRIHTQDVRSVMFIGQGRLVSASRDALIIVWKEIEGSPPGNPSYDIHFTLQGHEHFVNAVDYFPSQNILVSASADKSVRLWSLYTGECLGSAVEHSGNICAVTTLRASPFVADPDKLWFVTCSWDHTARLWCAESENNNCIIKCQRVFSAHTAPVWDACEIPDHNILLTTGADKTILAWDLDPVHASMRSDPIGVFKNAHDDVVRNIKLLPKYQTNTTVQFATSSNDGSIRLWNIQVVAQGHHRGVVMTAQRVLSDVHSGHFIYALSTALVSSVPSLSSQLVTQLMSGGEDSTLRLIRGSIMDDGSSMDIGSESTEMHITQTLPHSGTVWAAHCDSQRFGDIATGCSDGVVRVFSNVPERFASPEIIKAYETALRERKVAAQTVVGGVDTAKLPDESALTVPGKKDGENKIIKNSQTGVAEVHMWSSSLGSWQKIGDVVDNPDGPQGSGGGSREVNGKTYDFVFDVEVGKGAPHIKLGYNRGENPYVAAQRFIDDNDLSQEFLDEIAHFVENQAGPEALAAGSNAAVSDPLTGGNRYVPKAIRSTDGATNQSMDGSPLTEGRYRPKEFTANAPSSLAVPSKPMPKYIPNNMGYISYAQSEMLDKIEAKLLEYQGEPILSDADKTNLRMLIQELSLDKSQTVLSDESLAVCEKIAQRPTDVVFPALDIVRQVIARPSGAAYYFGTRNGEMLAIVLNHIRNKSASAAVQIMAGRFFCNLFLNRVVLRVAQDHMVDILQNSADFALSSVAKVREVFASLLQNYATLLYESNAPSNDRKLVIGTCIRLLNEKLDSVEAHVFGHLVALGTCMCGDKQAVGLAMELGAAGAAANAAPVSTRCRDVAEQIAQLLIG